MRLRLICTAHRPPAWVATGFTEYAKRLPAQLALNLVEIRPERSAGASRTEREDARVIERVRSGERVVLLDERGRPWTSRELAARIEAWQQDGRDVALVIGGADGVGEALRTRADETWSLSALTLPHALVRVVVAEQLYRAWTLLSGHPYHRE